MFYTTVGKDLGFIDRSIVQICVALFMSALLIIFLFFIFCNECKILGGLFSFKRNANTRPLEVEEAIIKKQVLAAITSKLIERKLLKLNAIENVTVEALIDNIETGVEHVQETRIRKEVLTDIGEKLSKKLRKRKLIKLEAIENVTVDMLVNNIDNSIHKVICKASEAVLSIQNKDDNVENLNDSKIVSQKDEKMSELKRSSSTDSFTVISENKDFDYIEDSSIF